MISIGILDDDLVFMEDFKNQLHICGESLDLELLIHSYDRPDLFLKNFENSNPYDLIFIDIEMEDYEVLNGIDVGVKIRKQYSPREVAIVYISSFPSYSMKLHPLEIRDFLIKDYNSKTKTFNVKDNNRLSELLQEMNSEIYYKNPWFKFTYQYRNYKILAKNIIYFDIFRKKVTLVYVDEKNGMEKKLEFRDNLKNIQSRLPTQLFTRIHRQILVNESYVQQKADSYWLLKNGRKLPVGSSYRLKLKENNDE